MRALDPTHGAGDPRASDDGADAASDRASAGGEHADAASDRASAGGDRADAAADRVSAGGDRVSAGGDRADAAADLSRAGGDRANASDDLAQPPHSPDAAKTQTANTPPPAGDHSPSRGAAFARSLADVLGSRSLRMVGVLLGLWTILALHPDTREAFLTAGNFSNLTAQISEIVIIGVGMTLVILIGGIDLSVGAGIALTGVVAAKLQLDLHQPAWIACLAAIAVAGTIGLWHGLLVTRGGVPPFVATLGGFLAYRGLALVLSDARGLSPMAADFQRLGARLPPAAALTACVIAGALGLGLLARRRLRRRRLGLATDGALRTTLAALAIVAVSAGAALIYQDGLPVPVLLAALAVALGAVLLRKTLLGRYAFAIGGNREAARLSGVPVAATTIVIYTLTGVCTAIAGIVAAARTNGVTPGNAGLMRELHVITAVVIGGTSLSGGRATMIGTVVGALIFGTLSNGMNLMNVNSNWQLILTGAILVGASLLDSLTNKKRTP
jgi:ABC-type xylose transport system permease subunit